MNKPNIAKAVFGDIFTVSEELTRDEIAAINSYLAQFAAPQEVCVGCDKIIRGGIVGFLIGGAPDSTSMEWSIAHGECHCVKCGWPARAYHSDLDGPIKSFSFTLQYHPDVVSKINE